MNEISPTPASAEKPQTLTLPLNKQERISIWDTETYPQDMIDRHVKRYIWARDAIQDQLGRAGAVLDFACGTGYGSRILLGAAAAVYGADKSESALKDARLYCRSS